MARFPSIRVAGVRPLVLAAMTAAAATAAAVNLAGARASAPADGRVSPAPPGLIEAGAMVAADSVTVGERFSLRVSFQYPDSLRMIDPAALNAGTCRVLSASWDDKKSRGMVERAGVLTLITLDLDAARFPETTWDFVAPSGDTLRAITPEFVIPVRRLVTSPEGAEVRPLKPQWEAPRNYLFWILAGVAAALAAAALVWWLRRRKRRALVAAPAEPKLPADYVALTELTRVERMNLLEAGEFKKYYTLVTDAVRRYLSARFDVDAMDRTTREIVDELDRRRGRVEKLEDLLNEADLVKFAKWTPSVSAGGAAMSTAREIVVKTAPHESAPENPELQDGVAGRSVAGAAGGR